MSPAKKNKNINELKQEQSRLLALRQALLKIYLPYSEEELQKFITEELPSLCQVDSIQLKSGTSLLKRNKYLCIHSFQYKDQTYSIQFHKKQGLNTQEIKKLRACGQALETCWIRMDHEQQLKVRKEQWELAFDTIASPICLTDLQGKIIRTNKTFREKVSGTSNPLKLGQKHYFSVFFGREMQAGQEETARLRREKVKRDGQEYVYEISLQKISEKGEGLQMLIFRDITEKMQLEYELAQSAKSAEMGIISSSIAHELNNPIAGIQILLQTLQIQEKSQELQDDLKQMSEAIQRCGYIINKLLNISPSKTTEELVAQEETSSSL